ncbi:hypothetical protein LLEC1_02230 [Akanthomyces lecanii]|uniref:Uncharacterized protein n=1 Tax=Cordyceps confragosa TaxID=2714763 RepID=A0A179I350_CORDF|nr:hypothetical protein LLEC1_02230 [Akanthomyces lecanii]
MASAAKASSQNAFLSLRARLRTPECSSQQFSGRVASAAQLDGSKIQEHLQRELRKVLVAHLSPEKQGDGISAGQNYALLEQLANSLAATGSKLHHQSTREVENVNEAIQSKIDDLSFESTAALAKSAVIYQIIAQPLAEVAESGADGQEGTVSERMALLHEELTSANEKIQSLHEKWQSCVRAEQEAWKRLTDAEHAPQPELRLQDFVDAAEEVMSNGNTKILDIEAEYAEHIQVESLKVMQTLMEG